jgi:hypothetical protein
VLDLASLTNRELLEAWTRSLEELGRRNLVRSYNNPIGDIAEAIVARYYQGVRGSFAQAAWDVKVGDELLQVKAVPALDSNDIPGVLSGPPHRGYTALILVVFSGDMRIEQAWRIPRDVVNEFAKFNSHVNGHKIALTAAVRNDPRVERLQLSQEAIDQPEPV